jgi:tRNA nucleotidyltransferase (CCA-adding enzyme)
VRAGEIEWKRSSEEAEEFMPDYMFLLESRLSPEQRAVLVRVQELARAQESNVYLTGGAVRDLISGMPLRDLDFTVEGNPARMVNELEKGGAKIVHADERLRHYELIFAGDADGSISAARDDFYARPGAKPEMRWSTVMEDLRRRDFAINAVAISLNLASRGLLLDPTNGLADMERHEVRALSIHAFTNQPIRLVRALRYCARMGFKLESRTQEWFDLAMERELHETIESRELGRELMDVAREENPAAVLKLWESKGMLALFHPRLQKRRADYDGLSRLARAREAFTSVGLRVRQMIPAMYYVLGRLKPREVAATLRSLEIPSHTAEQVLHLEAEGKKLLQILRGSKTKTAREAYEVISKTPTEMLAFVDAEFRNPRAGSKIRNYLNKWRPLRASLPVAQLDSLGVPRGPKFDKILEQLFDAQLRGRGRTPEDVTKLLKKLAGIKEEPKKKAKEEKKKNKGKILEAAKQKHGAAEAAAVAAKAEAEKGPAAEISTGSKTKEVKAGKKPQVISKAAPPRKAAASSHKAKARPHRAAMKSKKKARR